MLNKGPANPPSVKTLDWAVAIFSSRESVERLLVCIEAAAHAVRGKTAMIDVMVNGNADLAERAGAAVGGLALPSCTGVRIWSVAVGDKAHAWNEYLRVVVPDAALTFFVDGYAQVEADAFRQMASALAAHPGALAASGVPTMGRSARALRERMLRKGGLHGTLYALTRQTLDRMRCCGFRMPRGIYRNDALLGSALNFNFDATRHEWEPSRILVHPQASWRYTPLKWYRLGDIRNQWHRILRQAQGELERISIKHHVAIQQRSPCDFPPTVEALIRAWLNAEPAAARRLFALHGLIFWAWLRLAGKPQPGDLSPPTLIVRRGEALAAPGEDCSEAME